MVTLYLSSSQASSISADGSYITFQPQSSIELRKGSICRVLKATMWNSIQNVNTDNGNTTFRYTYNGVVNVITLTGGSYSLDDINESIREKMSNLGHVNMLTFIADQATSLVTLQATALGGFVLNIDFEHASNLLLKQYLGFTGVFNTNVDGTYLDSTNKAALNTYNSILLHLSFLNSSYFNNIPSSNIACSIEINAPTGSQVINEYINPVRNYINSTRNVDSFSVYLTDENNNRVNTGGEPWTCVISLDPPISDVYETVNSKLEMLIDAIKRTKA